MTFLGRFRGKLRGMFSVVRDDGDRIAEVWVEGKRVPPGPTSARGLANSPARIEIEFAAVAGVPLAEIPEDLVLDVQGGPLASGFEVEAGIIRFFLEPDEPGREMLHAVRHEALEGVGAPIIVYAEGEDYWDFITASAGMGSAQTIGDAAAAVGLLAERILAAARRRLSGETVE